MNKFLATLLIYCPTITSVVAGLPPTSTKVSGESVYSTTFKTDYGSMTATRSGTTVAPTQTGTGAMVLATSPTVTGVLTVNSTPVDTNGTANIFIGGSLLSAGTYNNSIGFNSMANMASGGSNNNAFGDLSGNQITTGQYNSMFGSESGSGLSTGSYNTILGALTFSFANGDNNTIVGYQSGGTGSYSGLVTLGNKAGTNSTADNQLWIANSDTGSGANLITGDFSTGRVGIGVDPGSINASAALQIDSTSKGLLPPRMTTAQKTAVSSPATGLSVFDTDLGKPASYNGKGWTDYSINDNFLINPNFEHATAASGWTCTVGTCTSTSTAGEFSEGTSSLKVALSAQAMNVSQSVTTVSGSTAQYVLGVSYRVPSTMADFQICTLIAGSEKTCVPSANLILDDAYHTIEIPEVITPGSTVGIKFKTTSTYTANAYFDKAYIKQGIGTQALQLDNVYSAKVSATGVVSDENKEFITGNCTNATPSICTLNAFTVAPNCQAVSNTTGRLLNTSVPTSTSISIDNYNYGGTQVMSAYTLFCQKSGNDYLAASAAVYSQASANYGRTSYYPQSGSAGFGTFTLSECFHSREGEYLNLECKLTAGTTTATEARLPLPNSLTVASSSTIPSIRNAGVWFRSNNATTHGGSVLIEPGVGYVTFSGDGVFGAATVGALTKANANAAFSSGDTFSLQARIPISGWSNSSSIVGTFENVVSTKGVSKPSLVSAVVSGTEVVTEDDSVFISSCTNAAPSVCTLTTSFFSAIPKCWANPNATGTTALVSTRSSSSVTVERTDAATAFTLFCHGAR